MQFGVCSYMHFACICPASTYVHGFQNNLAQLVSLRSKSAIGNICSGRLKVKVTLDDQMIKIELVRAINCTFMHGFQNDLAQLFSSKSLFRYVEGQGHN